MSKWQICMRYSIERSNDATVLFSLELLLPHAREALRVEVEVVVDVDGNKATACFVEAILGQANVAQKPATRTHND